MSARRNQVQKKKKKTVRTVKSTPRRTQRPTIRQSKMRPAGNGFAAVTQGALTGASIGNSLLPGIGGAVGGLLGAGAGLLYKTISGSGAYTIKENTLIRAAPVPSFGPSCIRIRHREYIGDIISSSTAGAFSLTSFALNPGLVLSFPWLALIAANYEEYKFNGLVFEFVSTSSNALNSTNTALGKVVMATDYNASNTLFTTIEQMLTTEFSNYSKPSESILHAIECSADQKPMLLSYIRTGSLSSGDIKMYDLGNTQIATYGMQGTSVNVGSLWVTYDITLCKPVLGNGLLSLEDHYILPAPNTTQYFGNIPVLSTGSNLGTTLFQNGDGTSQVIFPTLITSGDYMVIYIVNGNSTAMSAVTITLTNAVFTKTFLNSSVQGTNTGGITGDNYIMIETFTITGSPCSLSFGGGTLPADPTYGDLIIIRLPNDYS
jgi:hypothetical protein